MAVSASGDRAILDLFSKLKKQGEVTSATVRRVGELNERAVHGDQFGSMAYVDGKIVTKSDDWFTGDQQIPRIVVNKLMTLRMVWVALINKARISATAFPASEEPEDTYDAVVANALIDHCVSEEDTAEKVHTLIGMAFDHGTSALKIIHDVEDERATITNLSIFDYLIDNAPDYRDARWVLFQRWIDEEEADALWKQRGLVGEPATGTQKTATGEQLDGRVECWELYQKPTKAFPRGLYAFICGGEVCEDADFPYVWQDDGGKDQYTLPIVVAKTRQVRGSAYGGTNLSDAVPLQRVVNELNNRELQITRKTSGVHAWLPREAPENWDPAVDSVLRYDEGKIAAAPQFLVPPVVNDAIERQRKYYEEQIVDVIGINEVTAGATTTARSGVAQEQIFELDQAKNADASKSIASAVLEMFRLWLRVVAKFYPVDRKVKITGNTSSDIVMFSGADVLSVDVRLQESSELDKRDDVRIATAQAGLQTGVTTPYDVDVARKAPVLGQSKRVCEQLVTDYLAGAEVDPKPGVDFEMRVFKDVVGKAKARALSTGSKNDWVALHRLEAAVDQLAAESQGAPGLAPTADEQAPPPEPTAAPAPAGAP